MATPDLYGKGLDVVYGWPYRFTYATGYRDLGNCLARRLQTVRGSLPWDLNCGWDVRALFRGSLSAGEFAAAKSAIAAECEKDQRVDSANVDITYVPRAQTILITITVTGADGPFDLILSVDNLTVTLLRTVPQ